jgi:hypothetical protein
MTKKERRWNMKKIWKNLIVFAIMVLVMTPTLALAATGVDTGLNYAGGIGLGQQDPRTIAANVIKVILGFLGIIAVVMILIGGFKWMTSGGNTEKATEARGIITAAAIGLIIILAAYGVASFVITSVLNATGS